MKIFFIERPDTNAIEKEQNKYYSNIENLIFEECETCKAKPGSPTLCKGCWHNRRVISELLKRIK